MAVMKALILALAVVVTAEFCPNPASNISATATSIAISTSKSTAP
jgi:hypothetical protein